MKKLLSLLGAIGLVATSSATVVACDNTKHADLKFDQVIEKTNATDAVNKKVATSLGIEENEHVQYIYSKDQDRISQVADAFVNLDDVTFNSLVKDDGTMYWGHSDDDTTMFKGYADPNSPNYRGNIDGIYYFICIDDQITKFMVQELLK